jgi:hypothetical protein
MKLEKGRKGKGGERGHETDPTTQELKRKRGNMALQYSRTGEGWGLSKDLRQ